MSLPRRARVIRATRENAPAFDALRLLQPKVYLEVLQTAPQLYGSAYAKRGWQVFEKFCHTDGVMGVAKTSHFELGASDASAGLRKDVAELAQWSSRRVAKAMFGRTSGSVGTDGSPRRCVAKRVASVGKCLDVQARRQGDVLLRVRSSGSAGASAWA